MGLKDVFSRHKKSDDDVAEQGGDVSSPLDTRGEGPVTLDERTEPGGQGSPDTNQGKAEPGIPPRGSGTAPEAPPLEEMSVGSADPQSPEHPAARGTASSGAPAPDASPFDAPTDLSGPGSDPDRQRPEVDTETSTGRDKGPETPHQATSGTAQRAPGHDGSTPDGETIETDVEASAAAMVRATGRPSGSGDTHGVAVPSQTPSMGTSEEHGVVQGARIPDPDDPQ